MAIYHHSVSIVKRSAGQSAVGAAAYRAGQKIVDERTGIIHDYTRKLGVDYSVILSPVNADWIADRQQLWNKIEAAEKRHDARLSREVSLALPNELDRDYQIALVNEYVRENYISCGMIADINFHRLESNNPHVHIMLSLRELKTNEHGQVYFGNKNRDWDTRDLLIQQRQNWETLANQYLADAGYDRVKIDCRSLEAQGINRVSQIHLGPHAASMRAKGKATRIGDEYDRIEVVNHNIRQQLQEIYNDRSAITDLDRECEELNQQISDLQAEINQNNQILARIAQEKSDKITKPLTSNELIEMIGGDDRAKRIVQWCSKNLIIPDGQTEFKRESNSIAAKLAAKIIDSGSIAYVFTDVARRDQLQIICDRSSGEISEATGVVTGAIVNLISKIDNQALHEILRDLSIPKTEIQALISPDPVSIPQAETQASIAQDPVSIPQAETQASIAQDPISIPQEQVSAPEIDKVEIPTTPERQVAKNDRRVISRRSNEREHIN